MKSLIQLSVNNEVIITIEEYDQGDKDNEKVKHQNICSHSMYFQNKMNHFFIFIFFFFQKRKLAKNPSFLNATQSKRCLF